VGPVDLGLLADERIEAEKGFALGRRAHDHHETAQGALAAAEATLLEHIEQPRRAQARVFGQRLVDEVGVRHDQERRSWGGLGTRAEQPKGAADHVLVNAELGHDGAHLPVLSVT
jgi:hypothetical protein